MKFAYICAMPGAKISSIKKVEENDAGTFFVGYVPMDKRDLAIDVAKELVDAYKVQMIELCGGLANAKIVAKVKEAIHDAVPVGAVYYGPESRRPLVDLLNL